jgi:hypothetical protein
MSVRDRSFERAILARAERHAGVPADLGFAVAVSERLERYGREHGDTFDERPVVDLLAEIGEEALDLAGWSLLARTVLGTHAVPPASRERLDATLDAIATAGAEAYALVTRAATAAQGIPELQAERETDA